MSDDDVDIVWSIMKLLFCVGTGFMIGYKAKSVGL